tara:strand:- start:903 stop:1931 length:1029 start_codon:yes stop_codon:yes gene_type:complete
MIYLAKIIYPEDLKGEMYCFDHTELESILENGYTMIDNDDLDEPLMINLNIETIRNIQEDDIDTQEEPCSSNNDLFDMIKQYDIQLFNSIPDDNTQIAKGMCGGCIAITFYLDNDTLVVGHYISGDSTNEKYVNGFFNKIMNMINGVPILEIRIFAPTDIGVIKNEKISAEGVLKTLDMINVMRIPYDTIVFIEGTTSNHTFCRDVNRTTTISATNIQPKQAKIIYGIVNIIEYMVEVLKKDPEKILEFAKQKHQEELEMKERIKLDGEAEASYYRNLAQEDLEKYLNQEMTVSELNKRLIDIKDMKKFNILNAYKKVLREFLKEHESRINLTYNGRELQEK